MTKKDYVLIAKVISRIEDVNLRWSVCADMTTALYHDNNRFNMALFIDACKGNVRVEEIDLINRETDYV
jgi:hypothetical protein